MAMVEVTLVVDEWTEITDLDDPAFAYVAVDTTATVLCVFSPTEPVGIPDVGFELVSGFVGLPIPFGKSAWVKLLSGTGSIVYSQFGGILFDPSKCKHAWFSGTDEGIEQSDIVQTGFDDSGVEEYTWVGFLETLPAGIAAAATVDSAQLVLQLSKQSPEKQFRIYGVAEPDSVSSTLTAYADLASGLTLTTASVLFTVGYTGQLTLDIADILQELVGVSGWDATSPIQLWIGPDDAATTGEDTTNSVAAFARQTVIFASVS